MAKASYKIPKDLSTGPLDIEIPLKTDSGMGLRPISLRVILLFLASFLICGYCVTSTIVAAGGILCQVMFVIGWIICSAIAITPDPTGDLNYHKVGLLPDAMPNRRTVITRTSENATDFYYLSDIDSIDEDRGRIRFVDGSYGYCYRVDGSASVLLFDDDRDRILDRVAGFYANMGLEYEIIWLTLTEPQRVDHQVAAMDERIEAESDPDLVALAATEREQLVDVVGKEYKSIHQYCIIKGYTEDGLEMGRARLQHEVESSPLMIARCTAVYDDELHNILSQPFTYKPVRS